jgi:hypothetical protein
MWWDHSGMYLEQHGDAYERERWLDNRAELSNYERVWLKYVVPLTNRVDSRISPRDDQWIILRTVPVLWRDFATHNYSTFFYYCRAKELQAAAPEFYEAVFTFLRMCTYNLLGLLRSCDALLNQQKVLTDIVLNSPISNTIKLYRDVLLKNPVLGRSRLIGRGTLPRESVLRRILAQKPRNAIFTWEDTRQLTPAEFIKAEDLTSSCFPPLAQELQRAWRILDYRLDPHRADPAFLDCMGLDLTGRVPGDTGRGFMLTLQSPAASGDLI